MAVPLMTADNWQASLRGRVYSTPHSELGQGSRKGGLTYRSTAQSQSCDCVSYDCIRRCAARAQRREPCLTGELFGSFGRQKTTVRTEPLQRVSSWFNQSHILLPSSKRRASRLVQSLRDDQRQERRRRVPIIIHSTNRASTATCSEAGRKPGQRGGTIKMPGKHEFPTRRPQTSLQEEDI